jgi:hypothetical protein
MLQAVCVLGSLTQFLNLTDRDVLDGIYRTVPSNTAYFLVGRTSGSACDEPVLRVRRNPGTNVSRVLAPAVVLASTSLIRGIFCIPSATSAFPLPVVL